MGVIEQRIGELGLELPPLRPYDAPYLPAKQVDGMVYCSGHGPTAGGKPVYQGQVGAAISVADACKAAEIATLNCLATIKGVIGDLDAIEDVVKVTGFVNAAEDFHAHGEVINACSQLLVSVFGETIGKHARSTIGTSRLVNRLPVIIEMIVKVKR